MKGWLGKVHRWEGWMCVKRKRLERALTHGETKRAADRLESSIGELHDALHADGPPLHPDETTERPHRNGADAD